jgi:hypothetical protein
MHDAVATIREVLATDLRPLFEQNNGEAPAVGRLAWNDNLTPQGTVMSICEIVDTQPSDGGN